MLALLRSAGGTPTHADVAWAVSHEELSLAHIDKRHQTATGRLDLQSADFPFGPEQEALSRTSALSPLREQTDNRAVRVRTRLQHEGARSIRRSGGGMDRRDPQKVQKVIVIDASEHRNQSSHVRV